MADQSGVYNDIKALRSNLQVLSQKIKYLVHNEKVLGRNVLILNKKISSGNIPSSNNGSSNIDDSKIQQIQEKQKELEKKIDNLQQTMELFSKRYAKQEELKEMKYIIDNINPLEYTTVDQVKKIVKENKQN